MSEKDREEPPKVPEKAAEEAQPAAAKTEPAAEKVVEAKPAWLENPVVPEWSDAGADELVQALRGSHPEAIVSAHSFNGDLSLVVTREAVREVATSLKDEHGFLYIVDVAGVDYPDREERFEVVYHVYNLDTERRVRFKVSAGEEIPVPSLSGVWRGANWPEREAYDMYGIRFEGHPDLTRILLWEGFNGYPLRKEFPVEGIDTGSAIYPEYYGPEQGPISGDGTGWMVPKPPEPAVAAEDAEGAEDTNEGGGGGES